MDTAVESFAASRRKTAAYFNKRRWNRNRRNPRLYSEYWNLYASEREFSEIARILGETEDATIRRYERWFALFLGTRAQRTQRIHARREWRRQNLKCLHLTNTATYKYLSAEAGARGKSLTPAVSYAGTGVLKTSGAVYESEGKYLRLYHTASVIAPHGTPYARFQVSESALTGVHACILFVDVPGYDRELIIVRASFFRKLLARKGKSTATFYIPLGFRHRHRRHLNLHRFRNAWYVLNAPS